jgi:hypothetical protein
MSKRAQIGGLPWTVGSEKKKGTENLKVEAPAGGTSHSKRRMMRQKE